MEKLLSESSVEELERMINDARLRDAETFEYYGRTVLVAYAEYVVEFLRLKQKQQLH